MKVEITYENTDFRCGQRFQHRHAGEVWMLGYDPATQNTALISLSDGMISQYFTNKQELVDHLNESDLIPVEFLQLMKDWEII